MDYSKIKFKSFFLTSLVIFVLVFLLFSVISKMNNEQALLFEKNMLTIHKLTPLEIKEKLYDNLNINIKIGESYYHVGLNYYNAISIFIGAYVLLYLIHFIVFGGIFIFRRHQSKKQK